MSCFCTIGATWVPWSSVGDDLAPTEGWDDRSQNRLHDMRQRAAWGIKKDLFSQHLMHKLNNHGSFAHGRGDTLHALRSDVSPPHCEVRKILELRQSSPSPEPSCW